MISEHDFWKVAQPDTVTHIHDAGVAMTFANDTSCCSCFT